MQVIPLLPVPSQVVSFIANGQSVVVSLRQLAFGLYMDLQSDDAEVVGLVICENLNRIVRDLYFGFLGDFVFYDNTGQGQDPFYTGLGAQFSLIYIGPDELPPGVG